MTIESATYISDLNTANPGASDGKNEGDDHLRLLKSTIKTTFPNITGAVTATHTALNSAAAGNFTTQTVVTKTGGAVGSGVVVATCNVNDEVLTRITLLGIASWDQRITSVGTLQQWRANGSYLASQMTYDGYQTFYSRVGINGKTPVAAVAAPTGTDSAKITAIITALTNFGIFI